MTAKLGTRALTRLINPGNNIKCQGCGEWIKYRARHRDKQVICNIYWRGKWHRVEHWHLDCYDNAGRPHGEAAER